MRRALIRLAIWWLRRCRRVIPAKARLYWVWDEVIEVERDGDTVYRVEQIASPVTCMLGGKIEVTKT